MANSSSPIQDQIQALRNKYVAQMPEKIIAIEAAWGALQENHWNGEDLTTLLRLVHTLVGSGATFGLPDVSHAAREMETALKSLGVFEPTAELSARIRPLLDTLKRAALEAR